MIESGVDQEAVVSQVMDEWTTWKGARSEYERECYEIHRAFRSKHPTTRKIVAGRSNRPVPLPHKGAMNLRAQLMTSLFPHPDFFQVVPVLQEHQNYADLVGAELRYLLRYMRFYREAGVAILQAVLYGTSPWSLGWEELYTPATTDYVGNVPVRRNRLIYDGPRLVTRDIFNVVFDMLSNLPPDLVPRAMRTWRNHAYLRQMSQPDERGYAVYENVDSILEHYQSPEYGDDWIDERFETLGIMDPSSQHGRAGGRVEIIERWGDICIYEDGEYREFKNYLAVVGNRNTLLRFEPNPVETGVIPLQHFLYQPGDKPSELLGIGALGPARGLGDLATAVLNAFMDLVAKMIRGQYKYLAQDRYFEPDKWEDGTNALIKVGVAENLQPIINDISLFNVMQVYGMLKAEYQEAIGSTENLTSLKAPITATEFSGAASISSGRNRQTVQDIEASFVEPFLSLLIDYRRQYGPDEPVKRLFQDPANPSKGKDWRTIPPEAFAGQYLIESNGSGYIAMREERLRNYAQMMQVLGQFPPEVLGEVNLQHLIKRYYSEFGFKDSASLFKGSDPIERILAAVSSGEAGQSGAAPTRRGAVAPAA